MPHLSYSFKMLLQSDKLQEQLSGAGAAGAAGGWGLTVQFRSVSEEVAEELATECVIEKV